MDIKFIWNIGKGIERRLKIYGVTDLHGITQLSEKTLYSEFGINAEFLIDHAYGYEPCTIREIKEYKSKTNSLSNSQILFEDYKYDDALLVMKEMVDNLTLELIEKGLVTGGYALTIGYSKDCHCPTGGTRKLKKPTNSYKTLVKEFENLFRETTAQDYLIRRIGISFNYVVNEDLVTMQLDLFTDINELQKERSVQKAIIKIKSKYGKNALLKGMNFKEKATQKVRNKLIGGHNGE